MKKIIYIDMDDVLCHFSKAQKKALVENPAIGFPQSQYGFFRKLEPIEGAIDGVDYLLKQEKFDVYILTAPSIHNPSCYTEKREWVEEYLGMEMVKRLIISPHKGLNKGDFLIDDHIFGKGQENFEGLVIQYGSASYPSWGSILKFLNLR